MSAPAAETPRQAIWPQVRALSAQMRRDAEAGDWVAALQAMTDRTALLERFFAEPVPEPEAEAVATAIRRTLEEDASLRELGEQGRRALQDQLRSLNTGRKARRAYRAGK